MKRDTLLYRASFGYAQALPATLGSLGVGWEDLRRPGRLSATSLLTRFFFYVSTSGDGGWKGLSPGPVTRYKRPAVVYEGLCALAWIVNFRGIFRFLCPGHGQK